MNLHIQPDQELTEEEKLLAALVDLEQRIPDGYQVGMGLHLDCSMAAVETLFTEHGLPMREELVAELKLWRSHAEDGLKFAQHCQHLMQAVIRIVDGTNKHG